MFVAVALIKSLISLNNSFRKNVVNKVKIKEKQRNKINEPFMR